MQQFIDCLLSLEWLERHPTDHKKLIPTPLFQTSVKLMTQFLNDVLLSGKTDVSRLEFNPVAVVIEQLGNDLLEDLQRQANNQPHRLYDQGFCLPRQRGKGTRYSSLLPSQAFCCEVNGISKGLGIGQKMAAQREIVKESEVRISTSVFT
jgi:hypothetical protein